MTYKLTANKTKLYTLAASLWPDIPPMKHTDFTKAYRSRDCWLTFRTGKYPNTVYHKAFLMTSCGKAVLCDDWCCCTDDGYENRLGNAHAGPGHAAALRTAGRSAGFEGGTGMKVRYKSAQTMLLTYGGEYKVVKAVKIAGRLMGYRITCDMTGTAFVRPYEVEVISDADAEVRA